MLVLPEVRRQPLPGDEQAYLDYRSGLLIIDSDPVFDDLVPDFEAEAILCLNGRRDLATHVEPHRPRLAVLPGGLAEQAG